MNECYYYVLLFSLFSRLQQSLASEKDLANVTIQHVCENDVLFIKCLNINETIQIVRSMYGRTSQRICNDDLTARFFEKTCANIGQSKHQMKLHCQGKSTCQMLIDNQIFTDPCGLSIPKHFEVHYRCINKEKICSKLFVNCSKTEDIKCVEKIQDEFSCACPSTICQYRHDRISGFVESVCADEHPWIKTPINRTQSLPCPSPCTGKITRVCQLDRRWSAPNYTHCECPIKQSDRLSTHRSASGYVFQCDFWLINRILPTDNPCILSFTTWNASTNEQRQSMSCLWSAFERMTSQSCGKINSFGVDFDNLAWEILIPKTNESHFRLLASNYDATNSVPFNQIIVDRTEMIKGHSRAYAPMMVIDTKNRSMILIEQSNDFKAGQTANVTVIFTRTSSEYDYHYQCRAYRSTNFSSQLDSTNMFFACQSLCSNSSHVICQCPFFNPIMHYRLHIGVDKKSRTANEFSEECAEQINHSSEENLHRIDRYLKDVSSLQSAKKFLSFVEQLIQRGNLLSHWNATYRLIKQMEYVGWKILRLSRSFSAVHPHLEFFIETRRFLLENPDRSVSVTLPNRRNQDADFQLIFFTISNANLSDLLNSRVVSVYSSPKDQWMGNVQIEFRHLNISDQPSTCVFLKNIENVVQWSTDGCQLLSTNSTHSTCSCNHLSTFALFRGFEKTIGKTDTHQLLLISKIGCMVSIVCLLLTIVLLIIMRILREDTILLIPSTFPRRIEVRRWFMSLSTICLISRSRTSADDDLTTVRSILHTNMLLCLIIVQILFLFGIDQTKHKFGCRIISILLDYFLLATISWMFVDGIELLIALRHVFKIDRIRLIAYSLYSYGFPLLIVFLSITLSAKVESESNQYCWLSHDNSFIWAFAIPFILLILANVCFLITSMYSICQKVNPSDYLTKIRTSLRDMSAISILFGFTWIVALVYLYGQTMLFAYAFTIMNALHGLLILIFDGVIQKHVQNSLSQLCLQKSPHRSLLRCFVRASRIPNQTHKKSLEHFSLPDNTSSSGYSSAHSSDLTNKQLLCNQTLDYTTHLSRPISSFHNHYNRRSCLVHETSYLPSIPNNLLPNRLSTFRYQLPANEIVVSQEQSEQLLQKAAIHDDDHQYYEIR